MSSLLDHLLAALPLAVVLVLMLGRRWGGAQAGAVAWVAALLVAILRFGAGLQLLVYAQLKGLLLSLFVLYIIWAALLFYRVTDEAGAVGALGAGLLRMAPDATFQALLLGWLFSAFLQGIGGFGVPTAVVAPLLMGLGFAPVQAIVIPSVGHAWAVTFGSLGSSFFALVGATSYGGAELAPWSAVMLGVACLCCGFSVLWIAGGRAALRRVWVHVLVVGGLMAATQYVVVTHGLWPLGSMLGALVGLGAALAWARLLPPRLRWWSAPPPAAAATRDAASPVLSSAARPVSFAWAMVPYVLLVAIVLAAEMIGPVGDLLGKVVVRTEFPELVTSRGWVVPAEAGRSIDVFGHAGALLVYASAVTFVLYSARQHYRPGALQRVGRSVAERAVRSSVGIAAMVGMAATMEHAGMTHLLANGLASAAGSAFPWISPWIGALGAFMTGSNTNSNVVFGGLQERVATLVSASPVIILAAQTAGGAVGSVFAPAKVIVGSSTVGLEGKEAPVLRATMRYGLVVLLVLSLATALAVIALG